MGQLQPTKRSKQQEQISFLEKLTRSDFVEIPKRKLLDGKLENIHLKYRLRNLNSCKAVVILLNNILAHH